MNNDRDQSSELLSSRGSRFYDRKILILASAVVVTLLIDTEIANISDIIADRLVTDSGIALFIAIAGAFGIQQYFVLRYIGQKSKEIRARSFRIRVLHTVMKLVQYSLIAVFVFTIAQVLLTSQYQTASLMAVTTISFITEIAIMGLLLSLFFSWYKSTEKKNRMLLIYGIAFIVSAINAFAAFALYSGAMLNLPPTVTSESIAVFPMFEPDTALGIIQNWYIFAAIGAFVAIWIGTVMLLRHYSNKIGKLKFWIIMGIPLAFFLGQIPPLYLGLLAPSPDSDPTIFILVITLSSVASGILFGSAFLSVAKGINASSPVRGYMIMAAYGFLLNSVASAGSIAQASYPPFGFATVSFIALSMYMIFMGLYSSAISLTQDEKLRQSINKSVQEQSRFLESIRTGQMFVEIKKKAMTALKADRDRMITESGIEPSLGEDELNAYMELVIDEISKSKQ